LRAKTKDRQLKFIDLFSGIGGFHLALEGQGHQCVFASEIDKYARVIYENNFGLKPHGDIKPIKAEDIPAHDILCAGFPCQPFSIAGKQAGLIDTRGSLFLEIVRIAKYHQPKMLLLENVANLQRHDGGRTFEIIKNELQNIGYQVYHKILNSGDFGTPQQRKRIYIVCLRAGSYTFPAGDQRPCCVRDILEAEGTSSHVINKPPEAWVWRNDPVIPRNKLIRIGHCGKGSQAERVYSPLGHSATLCALGGGMGAKTGLYLIDSQVRKLSPREAARLQGYPDTFDFSGQSDAQTYKQLGNSVTVPVISAIASALSPYLSLADRLRDYDGYYECEEVDTGSPKGEEIYE